MDNDSLEGIVGRMREKLSGFCRDECYAWCCRSGMDVNVSSKEVGAIYGTLDIEILIDEGKIRQVDEDEYTFKLKPCPALVSDRCSIYNNKDKPVGCSDYPIKVRKNRVPIHGKCWAVRNGVLDSYIERLLEIGVDVEVV